MRERESECEGERDVQKGKCELVLAARQQPRQTNQATIKPISLRQFAVSAVLTLFLYFFYFFLAPPRDQIDVE